MGTPILQLKQKRRRPSACGVRRREQRLLIFGQQAREQEPQGVKSAHTDAQVDVVRSFVTHSGKIIAQVFVYNGRNSPKKGDNGWKKTPEFERFS
jgi:hypothetical protein